MSERYLQRRVIAEAEEATRHAVENPDDPFGEDDSYAMQGFEWGTTGTYQHRGVIVFRTPDMF